MLCVCMCVCLWGLGVCVFVIVYNDFILYCFVWLCSFFCFVFISIFLFVFCVFHWLVIDIYVFFTRSDCFDFYIILGISKTCL